MVVRLIILLILAAYLASPLAEAVVEEQEYKQNVEAVVRKRQRIAAQGERRVVSAVTTLAASRQ